MPDTYKKLDQRLVNSTATTLFTVGSGKQVIVKHIRIVNNDTSARTIRLWHDGSNPENAILPPTSIRPGGWAEFDGTITMEAADTLVAQASVSSQVTVTVYGLEIS